MLKQPCEEGGAGLKADYKSSSLAPCPAVVECETSVEFRGDTEYLGLMKLTVYVHSSGSSAFTQCS